ncbi:MAG TPA: ATP-binding protein, partial [Nitrospirota bacterium]|nr:ATP-binding protein [Nitrospirota bacterium]
ITMKIRDKLFLGFGLYIFLAVILGFFAYKELRTISMRLVLVETADDITNTILEVRRYEKNFLLFKDLQSLEELQKYLGTLTKNIDDIKAEIVGEIGDDNAAMMKQAIADYESLIRLIAENFTAQKETEYLIRNKGRKAEQALGSAELQAFLVLRRYEKNIMLYRNNDAYAVFKRTYDASTLASHPEIKHYQVLVTKLYHLYEAEKTAVEKMRITARDIQSFTQNLSKKERSDIATTIKMSISLLLIALVLILVFGTIINMKLARSIATPIRTLEKITKKIAQGDFSESIEVKGKDELASLEIAFNQMEERLKNALWSLEHTIEKLREKQAQLVEAEKLASVGMLAAGIAHEINNPLTSVLTFSNLILEQCPKDNPWCEKLKIMVRETERARNIVRQLLNFGREANIKPVKININRPVSEIIDSLIAQEAFQGIELDMTLSENLPEVYADPAQIGQVVLNLALNAIHAITPPGRIQVSTRPYEKNVEIVFSDTGAGIPEENIHKIFDPFFTTKDATKGTGLGLAVSYGIIKKHGGDIEVASTVGQGTTFTVRLPIYEQV